MRSVSHSHLLFRVGARHFDLRLLRLLANEMRMI